MFGQWFPWKRRNEDKQQWRSSLRDLQLIVSATEPWPFLDPEKVPCFEHLCNFSCCLSDVWTSEGAADHPKTPSSRLYVRVTFVCLDSFNSAPFCSKGRILCWRVHVKGMRVFPVNCVASNGRGGLCATGCGCVTDGALRVWFSLSQSEDCVIYFGSLRRGERMVQFRSCPDKTGNRLWIRPRVPRVRVVCKCLGPRGSNNAINFPHACRLYEWVCTYDLSQPDAVQSLPATCSWSSYYPLQLFHLCSPKPQFITYWESRQCMGMNEHYPVIQPRASSGPVRINQFNRWDQTRVSEGEARQVCEYFHWASYMVTHNVPCPCEMRTQHWHSLFGFQHCFCLTRADRYFAVCWGIQTAQKSRDRMTSRPSSWWTRTMLEKASIRQTAPCVCCRELQTVDADDVFCAIPGSDPQ